MKLPPFACVAGRHYLVVNFDLEPADNIPLPHLLAELLQHHPAESILILRPLTKAEQRLLKKSAREAEREAWAQMVVRPEDRFRGRR